MPRVLNLIVGNGPKKQSLVTRPELPFDVPQFDAFYKKGGTQLLGTHIMATQQRSIDNKNGLTDPTEYIERVFMPRGVVEGTTDHRVYGGLYRNRPIKRAPLTGSGTRGADDSWSLKDKIFQLQSLIDGYNLNAFIDVLGADTFPHVKEWAQAAVLLGWTNRLIFMPDASVSIVRNGPTNLKNYTVQAFSDLKGGAAWMKHSDGRRLVVPYGPEFCKGDPTAKDAAGAYLVTTEMVVQYWLDYCQQMDAAGYPVALGCMFSRAWRDANSKTAVAMTDPRLKPWVVYLGRWGVRSPGGVVATGIDASGAAVYSRTAPPNGYGLPYIDTFAIEDTRPNQGKGSEPLGWSLIMEFWKRAFTTRPEGIQYATANDFAEGTASFPSEYCGYSILDFEAYYNIWWVMGVPPEIKRDACFLAYRIQNAPGVGTQPTYAADADTHTVTNADGTTSTVKNYTKKMVKTDTTAMVNNVFVAVFATAPATLRVTIGGVTEPDVSVPAGLNQYSFPLRSGTISARLLRNNVVIPGSTANSIPGQDVNLTNQEVQDITYRRVNSLRSVT